MTLVTVLSHGASDYRDHGLGVTRTAARPLIEVRASDRDSVRRRRARRRGQRVRRRDIRVGAVSQSSRDRAGPGTSESSLTPASGCQ